MATSTTSKTAPKTTSAKKTASTARKTRASAAPESTAAKAPTPGVVTQKPVVAGAEMRKRELMDKVVERSGVRKKFAKPVVEAMIEVLGETIAEGRAMNLQPLGKIMMQRSKDTGNARITIAKIRQAKSAAAAGKATPDTTDKSDKETVADPGE